MEPSDAIDTATKAAQSLIASDPVLGSVCVLLLLALAAQFILNRRDVASRDKIITALHEGRLSDTNLAFDRVTKALEVIRELGPVQRRQRGG